jgi:hypothetical protein
MIISASKHSQMEPGGGIRTQAVLSTGYQDGEFCTHLRNFGKLESLYSGHYFSDPNLAIKDYQDRCELLGVDCPAVRVTIEESATSA